MIHPLQSIDSVCGLPSISKSLRICSAAGFDLPLARTKWRSGYFFKIRRITFLVLSDTFPSGVSNVPSISVY